MTGPAQLFLECSYHLPLPSFSCDGEERSRLPAASDVTASRLLRHLRWPSTSALGDSSGGAKGMWGGRNVETKQGNRTGLTVSVQLEGSDVCLGANSLNNALRWLDNMVSRLHAN